MSDLAAVLFSLLGSEGHALGQMEAPVLFEGQVSLLGVADFLITLHQLDHDVRGVEVAHMADQGVNHPELCWVMAIHHDLGRS